MTEEKTQEKPITESKVDIKEKPSFNYQKDIKSKSLRQIATEGVERSTRKEEFKDIEKKELPDKKEVKEQIIEEKKEAPLQPQINVDDIKREAAEEATKKAKESFQEEMSKILEKNKSIEDRQKEADDLISIWDKEKRLPKDYKEIIDESLRISEAKYKQLKKQDEDKLKEEAKAKQEEQEKSRAIAQKNQQDIIEGLNKRVTSELDELYTAGFIKKPPEKYNENDEVQKETDNLLKFGIELNVERNKKGLAPIDSVSKIYFMYYKPFKDSQDKTPSDQPPGADAPISGGKVVDTGDSKTKGYVYARDHKKSYRQILMDNYRRVTKR